MPAGIGYGDVAEERAENPRHAPDPRFDPADDAAHADAVGVGAERDRDADLDDLHATVKRAVEDARDFFESNLEPEMIEATDYYWGRPFGDEREGRSKVVSPVVRDVTLAQMPSFMRIVFGSEHIVEYRARLQKNEEQARQATEYVRYIVTEDNPGFLHIHAAVKDGLVRRLGIFKWWWEEEHRTERTKLNRLTPEDLLILSADDAVDQIEIVARRDDGTVDAQVTHHNVEGRARFCALPPEEFLFTPDARLPLAEVPLVAHTRDVRKDELLAMGIPEEAIDRAAKSSRRRSRVASGGLEDARQYHEGAGADTTDDARPEETKTVLFTEAYMLVGGDEEGRPAERRLFLCVGDDYEVVNGEGDLVDDDLPFAIFTPEPEPHTIVGLSNWDKVKDVQRITSQLLRGALDSIAEALVPMTEVVQGEVNVGDLIKPDVSRIVRTRRPGMLQVHKVPFIGGDVLAMLDYFKGEREDRTGTSRAGSGLDADALQSSTKAAVAATISASQQQIEMLVRVFAETALKDLFRGLLRLVISHQDKERVVRLRGQYVAVDPRSWDASMDVQVNVALGQGTPEDRLATLSGLISSQMTLLGQGSPLVTNVELRAALAQATELAGFPHADKYYRPWGSEQETQMQEARAQQPPPPDPQMAAVQMAAEVERMKAQTSAQVELMKLELEKYKVELQDDREREKMVRDAALREYEIEAKYGSEIVDSELKAKVAADRAASGGADA